MEKEKLFNDSVGKYRTAKKYAEDMTKLAKDLSTEGMEFAHVRSLPV
jgi:hypothetical protein